MWLEIDFQLERKDILEMNTLDTFIIETHNLTKSYKNVDALRSLNLKVPQNSVVAFLGPNGAGKTTTIKLLLGLIRPTAGQATLFGYDMVKDSVSIRQRIGYLPQEPRFYDYMTARETLHFTARFFDNRPASEIEPQVAETLALVGLEDKADRPVKSLSGGERQRLGIAQAQINRPELLILDEPAANLDPQGRRDVLGIIEQLRANTTIFYSTHILDDVQRVSDFVVILNQGALVAQATIDSMLHRSNQTIYTLITKGNHEAAHIRVSKQPWVTEIDLTPLEDVTKWQIKVTDIDMAETHLLRQILANENLNVIEFGRNKQNLEDAFLDIILEDKGENHD